MGPGIQPDSTVSALVGNYDLPVTWAALAAAAVGVPEASGRSLLPLIHPHATAAAGEAVGAAAAAGWRTYTLQEGYQSCEAGHGEGKACSGGDAYGNATEYEYEYDDVGEYESLTSMSKEEYAEFALKGRDYSGMRFLDPALPAGDLLRNAMYVEYTDGGKVYYDCEADPWQTRNIFHNLTSNETARLSGMLAAVRDCNGTQCP